MRVEVAYTNSMMTSKTPIPSNEHVVDALWQRLGTVTTLDFRATSELDDGGWNGRGEGQVTVEQEGTVIRFVERGTWQTVTGETLTFRNTFRWTLLDGATRVKLEHLRFGEAHPVFLFDLVGVETSVFESAAPHLCNADVYTGRLVLEETGFTLDWFIQGPKKEEHIRYRYA